jgi:hypothetical protein
MLSKVLPKTAKNVCVITPVVKYVKPLARNLLEYPEIWAHISWFIYIFNHRSNK